jgi:hypothetical protein
MNTNQLRDNATHKHRLWNLPHQLLNEAHGRELSAVQTSSPYVVVLPRCIARLPRSESHLFRDVAHVVRFIHATDEVRAGDSGEVVRARLLEAAKPAERACAQQGGALAPLPRGRLAWSEATVPRDTIVETPLSSALTCAAHNLADRYTATKNLSQSRASLNNYLLRKLHGADLSEIEHIFFSRYGIGVLYPEHRTKPSVEQTPRTYLEGDSILVTSQNTGSNLKNAIVLEEAMVRMLCVALEIPQERISDNLSDALMPPTDDQSKEVRFSTRAEVLSAIDDYNTCYGAEPDDIRGAKVTLDAAQVIDQLHAHYVSAAPYCASMPWRPVSSSSSNKLQSQQWIPARCEAADEQVGRFTDTLSELARKIPGDSSEAIVTRAWLEGTAASISTKHEQATQALQQGLFIVEGLGYEAYQEMVALLMVLKPSEYDSRLLRVLAVRYGQETVAALSELYKVMNDSGARNATEVSVDRLCESMPSTIRFAAEVLKNKFNQR